MGISEAISKNDGSASKTKYNNAIYVIQRALAPYAHIICSHICEVATIFLATALGIPVTLIPIQLLWANLFPDGAPQRSHDSLIRAWVIFRYLVIEIYIGVATVGVFIIWYTHGSFLGIDLTGDGHTIVTYSQLSNFGQCPSWENFKVSPFKAGVQVFIFEGNPCDYFQTGNVKAMTLFLSVLVVIGMFNSINILSEDGGMLSWVNPWLLMAMFVSFSLHFLILYVPILAQVFGIVPLSLNEWLLVLTFAFPVILINEVLKFFGKCTCGLFNRFFCNDIYGCAREGAKCQKLE